jgi:DNA modification methylase
MEEIPKQLNNKINIVYVPIGTLYPSPNNPRTWTEKATADLTESIKRFGITEPIIANSCPERKNKIISGHFRWMVAKNLGIQTVPVVYLNIPSIEKEEELLLRMNANQGAWNWEMLANFDESFLSEIGFTSEDLDQIFAIDETPEIFDLEKELRKLDITEIKVKKGDVYQLGESKLMCGDSTIESDFLTLMNNEKADMCLTDPPYILDYLKGKKKNGKPTEGFGLKRDRKYLETDVLPDNFTELWMKNVAMAQKPDFSIIVFENPKNLRTIWNEIEKYWKYRNTITWHLPNRVSGFAAKYKFFNKADIALVGTGGNVQLNLETEDELFQNEYENALFATSGKPHWESYEKGKKYCPTDFIEFNAADEKSSGQSVIFGTKPLELLIPYLKVLTKRGDLIVEPFGGSGSSLIAAEKMGRRCYIMEKVPTYAEIILRRWSKLTNKEPKLIKHGNG